jgi:hypothetical protein
MPQSNSDVPTMRRAREILEQAADRGHLDSASLAINLNHELGDPSRAQRFVTLVQGLPGGLAGEAIPFTVR